MRTLEQAAAREEQDKQTIVFLQARVEEAQREAHRERQVPNALHLVYTKVHERPTPGVHESPTPGVIPTPQTSIFLQERLEEAQREAHRERQVNLRITTSQKCAAVPRRARISGSQTFVSINSRLKSNKEEEAGSMPGPGFCLSIRSSFFSFFRHVRASPRPLLLRSSPSLLYYSQA